MAMFVKANDSDPDCRCPHCNQGLEIEEWDAPCDSGCGYYDKERCPKCNKEIGIKTSIIVTYTAEII